MTPKLTDIEYLTPEAIEQLYLEVGNVKSTIYCAAVGLSPMAEQHVNLALESLAAARAYLLIAKYHLMRKD